MQSSIHSIWNSYYSYHISYIQYWLKMSIHKIFCNSYTRVGFEVLTTVVMKEFCLLGYNAVSSNEVPEDRTLSVIPTEWSGLIHWNILMAAVVTWLQRPLWGNSWVNMFPWQQIHMQQWRNCWKSCFLCSPCWGYIVRASEPNCAGNKQGSYDIMRITMFAAQDKAKPDTENVRGLNLAVIKLTTIQVTKLLF
jgi:hypothetical protein